MTGVQTCALPILTKIFISHLHTDHWGDLAGLWAGGWTAGRTGPLEVWGPSGARPDMGTKHAIEHFLQTYNWDSMTRQAMISPVPGRITVHEFDYKGENEIIYQENGVTVRSWPAIHAGDGPVSLALEWNGYKIVYSGDTMATNWTLEYAQDADLLIHEATFDNEEKDRAQDTGHSTAAGAAQVALAARVGSAPQDLVAVAEALRTTDSRAKLAATTVDLPASDGTPRTITVRR